MLSSVSYPRCGRFFVKTHNATKLNKPVALASVVVEHDQFREKIMYKLATAILLLASPVFAQNIDALRDCPPTGQTAKGEMV
jgi:hypothetical protein